MAQLRHWCKDEGINPSCALLAKDVPEDTEIALTEETRSIKTFGLVKVRGRIYDPLSQGLTVLCEFSQHKCHSQRQDWWIFGRGEYTNGWYTGTAPEARYCFSPLSLKP